jgi:hypothetical protein
MTLYQFRSLSEEQQANSVWDGVFLDLRTHNDCNVLLYDLGGFYVEVYYLPILNKIIKLRPFKSVKPLEPYLDQLNTEELDNLIK